MSTGRSPGSARTRAGSSAARSSGTRVRHGPCAARRPDGPLIETKELLGGFIVLDVPDEATALEIAAAWPGLAWPGDAVEVRPVGDSQAEVNV